MGFLPIAECSLSGFSFELFWTLSSDPECASWSRLCPVKNKHLSFFTEFSITITLGTNGRIRRVTDQMASTPPLPFFFLFPWSKQLSSIFLCSRVSPQQCHTQVQKALAEIPTSKSLIINFEFEHFFLWPHFGFARSSLNYSNCG